MTTTNGGPTQPVPQGQPGADQQPPQLNVLAQYIKDFSFENPNAPRSLQQQQGSPPPINIQVNVNARQLGPNDFEVELKLEGGAGEPANKLFNFELAYCGVFQLVSIPEEHKHPVVMIDCPQLLFPFARQIVAEPATRRRLEEMGYVVRGHGPAEFQAMLRDQNAKWSDLARAYHISPTD